MFNETRVSQNVNIKLHAPRFKTFFKIKGSGYLYELEEYDSLERAESELKEDLNIENANHKLHRTGFIEDRVLFKLTPYNPTEGDK